MSEHNVYTIQLASKVSGVGIHTIRAWEKRYNAVTPRRGDTGRREYTQTEVERLSLLCQLCTLGHTIGQIARLKTTQLEELLQSLGKVTRDNVASEQAISPTINLDHSIASLLLALQSYKLDVIAHELNKLSLVVGPRELALKVIVSLMREVGASVANGSLSLSQEHALMALLRFHLGHALFRFKDKNRQAGSVIICAPEGELDEMPSLQAALVAAHHHYAPIYLGPNLPCSALLDVLASTSVKQVILMLPPLADNTAQSFYDRYLEKVMEHMKTGAQLIVYRCDSFHREKFSKSKHLVELEGVFALDKFFGAR